MSGDDSLKDSFFFHFLRNERNGLTDFITGNCAVANHVSYNVINYHLVIHLCRQNSMIWQNCCLISIF